MNRLKIAIKYFIFIFNAVLIVFPNIVSGREHYDTLSCKRDPAIIYSVYLPENASRYLMIYLLDPAGRSNLAIDAFKSAADHHNLMLICSQNSVNGPIEENRRILNEVLLDVRERFSLDSSRIILSGFSGGARAAVGIAALEGELVAGVVGCGAGPPRDHNITGNAGYAYVGLTGIYDMNFYEMIELNANLDQLPNFNKVIFFDGGHQWPPDDFVLLSITWLMHVLHPEEVPINELYALVQQSLEQGREQFETWLRIYELKEVIGYFENFLSVHEEKTQLSELRSLKIYEKDIKSFENYRSIFEEEKTMMVDELGKIGYSYLGEADLQTIEWWRSKVQFINGLTGSRDIIKRNAGLRLEDFLWRNCSEQGFIYFSRDHYSVVLQYDQIWKLIQPESYLPWIRSALCYKEMEDRSSALNNLKKAVKMGFSNRDFLTEQFSDLSSEKQFKKILEGMSD